MLGIIALTLGTIIRRAGLAYVRWTFPAVRQLLVPFVYIGAVKSGNWCDSLTKDCHAVTRRGWRPGLDRPTYVEASDSARGTGPRPQASAASSGDVAASTASRPVSSTEVHRQDHSTGQFCLPGLIYVRLVER